MTFEWLETGKITGLRVDHPDGLWDPKEYLQRLQKDDPTYVVVEKILSGGEQLPNGWKTEGTTGYDFFEPGERACSWMARTFRCLTGFIASSLAKI